MKWKRESNKTITLHFASSSVFPLSFSLSFLFDTSKSLLVCNKKYQHQVGVYTITTTIDVAAKLREKRV